MKLLHYCTSCSSITLKKRQVKNKENGTYMVIDAEFATICENCKEPNAYVMNTGLSPSWVKSMLVDLHKRVKELESKDG